MNFGFQFASQSHLAEAVPPFAAPPHRSKHWVIWQPGWIVPCNQQGWIWSCMITGKWEAQGDVLPLMPGSLLSCVPGWHSSWRRWWLAPSVSWRWYLAGCLDTSSVQSWFLSQLLQFFHTSPLNLKQIYMWVVEFPSIMWRFGASKACCFPAFLHLPPALHLFDTDPLEGWGFVDGGIPSLLCKHTHGENSQTEEERIPRNSCCLHTFFLLGQALLQEFFWDNASGLSQDYHPGLDLEFGVREAASVNLNSENRISEGCFGFAEWDEGTQRREHLVHRNGHFRGCGNG